MAGTLDWKLSVQTQLTLVIKTWAGFFLRGVSWMCHSREIPLHELPAAGTLICADFARNTFWARKRVCKKYQLRSLSRAKFHFSPIPCLTRRRTKTFLVEESPLFRCLLEILFFLYCWAYSAYLNDHVSNPRGHSGVDPDAARWSAAAAPNPKYGGGGGAPRRLNFSLTSRWQRS